MTKAEQKAEKMLTAGKYNVNYRFQMGDDVSAAVREIALKTGLTYVRVMMILRDPAVVR
jgi:hypothetical protein